MVGKMHPSEKVNAGSECFDRNFIGMKRKVEFYLQKTGDSRKKRFKVCFIFAQNHEIVRIADVATEFERMFDILVELVHVHIY